MATPGHIMLIASCTNGRVHPETDDLLGFGQSLQALTKVTMGVWILGEDVSAAAREIAGKSGLPVTAVGCPGLSPYVSESYAAVLAEEIAAVKPTFVCAAHTSQGWEWTPAVAARMGAGCICGVDGIAEVDGRICFQKELYGGKVKGLFSPNTPLTVVSVLPGIFKFTPLSKESAGHITHKPTSIPPARTRYLGIKGAGADTSDISTAPVIVAVGNGIGAQENLALAYRLARLLPKAVVAGSRILCDRGWLGYDRQVGVSGATVKPALYMACGISGASQHVSGMRGAKFVIAINTDPHAPIFNEADICIVEDITRLIPLIEEACARLVDSTDQTPDGKGSRGEI